MAFTAHFSATNSDAYFVDLRDPLNPRRPPDIQNFAFPLISVKVAIVLLRVFFT